MSLPNVVKNFKNQSLKNQLQLSFLLMATFLFLITIATSMVWKNAYVEEIHKNAYKDISIISRNNVDKLNSIESISYSVIDSFSIQKKMSDARYILSTDNRSRIANNEELNREINNITRNNNLIQTAYLFNINNENMINFIANKEYVINGYSSADIINDLPDTPSQGKWFFSDNLAQGVYARKIFSTVDFSLEHVGTILILVDTSFFQLQRQQLPFISDDNLFFLDYNATLYNPDSKQNLALPFKYKLEESQSLQKSSFGQIDFHNNQYYFATDSYDEFTFHYLIPDNKIMSDLNRLYGFFLLISIPFLIVLIILIYKISNQLTQPISQLTTQMKEIQKTKDINSLKELPIPINRQDEIAVLYESYNAMINETNQLIKDNYEIRILSQEIEFKGLQAQLDPHFLYNTLDSINWLALANNQTEISDMVTSLAYLFRKKIDTDSVFTTLEDELEIVNAYIRIQKIRFGKRIEYIELILIDDLSIRIPKLLIQPLIENIFKHALTHMKTTCQIILSVEVTETDLVVKVSDNGPGMDPDFSIEESDGIGLKNIQQRLNIHYDSKAHLIIKKSIPFKKTVLMFNIPLDYLKRSEEK